MLGSQHTGLRSIVQFVNDEVLFLGSPLYFLALFQFEFDRSPRFWFINVVLAADFPNFCP